MGTCVWMCEGGFVSIREHCTQECPRFVCTSVCESGGRCETRCSCSDSLPGNPEAFRVSVSNHLCISGVPCAARTDVKHITPPPPAAALRQLGLPGQIRSPRPPPLAFLMEEELGGFISNPRTLPEFTELVGHHALSAGGGIRVSQIIRSQNSRPRLSGPQQLPMRSCAPQNNQICQCQGGPSSKAGAARPPTQPSPPLP